MNNILNTPIESFSESEYLEANPDLAAAIRNGLFPSGWAHYITNGYYENRLGVGSDAIEALRELLDYSSAAPVPPEHLRIRVHGAAGLAQFENIGNLTAIALLAAFKKDGGTSRGKRAFDFGCGCGRVLKYIQKLTEDMTLYGTDIDSEAISWCQQNLSHIGEFATNGAFPPLSFDNDFFDLVYAVSVFTHLPEEMQFKWLAELCRVTKPGGHLLLTTHGHHLLSSAPDSIQQQLLTNGFLYSVGPGTDGLPDFYQTSFHTHDYIQKEWEKFFEVREIISRGMIFHQDLVICRKRYPGKDSGHNSE